jgi:two-component sensor histidine kinase
MDEAIPCGLIINELVSNALKYAFADEDGELTVSLNTPDDAHRLLRVYDNGSGLPQGMDIHSTTTLGLQLVDTLAEQLGGELTINCECGTDIRILFPIGKGEKA